MTEPNSPGLSALSALADKIALEIVFAEPGNDNGLLPINSLLSDMEALGQERSVPAPFAAALKFARRVVDEVLEQGAFSAVSVEHLKQWLGWCEDALASAAQGASVEPFVETAAADPGVSAPPGTLATGPEAAPGWSFELNLETDGDLLREFVSESHEHLQNIELGVLNLEENPGDADTLNSIFRAFHTFKGGSGFLNLRPINRLAHELESLLDLARQHKLTIDSEVANLILTGGDTLRKFIGEIEEQLAGKTAPRPITIPIEELLGRVRALLERGSEAAPGLNHEPVEAAAAGSAAPAASPETTAGRPTRSAASIKVDTQKLDTLLDLVGEMVIAEAMVVQDPALASSRSQRLARSLAQLTRVTRELQRVSMSLRMVPVRPTFQKMTRLVRDLSVKAGKNVQLEMDGEETELDRNVVEELNDPLVHMIRNSVDHGIEPAGERVARGKPAQGTIRLAAYHQGGNIVIEVADDGAGLPRDKILARAIERGLTRPEAQLTDSEIFGFIFGAGFSTAERVTDISGRGVGMDVVRRNIDKLRGRIEVESVAGQGARFSIHMPLTLAIIDGLILGVGCERYILPTLSVRESFRPRAGMISTVHGRGELVNVRGRLIPLVRLHELLGIVDAISDPMRAIVVVIESENRCQCLLVDELLGKQEVVIKSLDETLKRNPALAGAAILGDGRVGLILDVAGLFELNRRSWAEAA